MKIYIYNINNKNQFLNKVQVESINGLQETATTVRNKKHKTIGKSYAFDVKTKKWDVEIDDWRGVVLYNKNNSLITREGKVQELPNDYTNISPIDTQYSYRFIDNKWVLNQDTNKIEIEIQEYKKKIQQYIDQVAQNRGYDNGYACVSYYDDKNARYNSDAKIFKDWRSDVWVYTNDLLNKYQNKQIQSIPSIMEVLELLPKIEWKQL